jgi:hypothetical protein
MFGVCVEECGGMGGILERRRGGDARLLTEYEVSRGQYWFLRIVSDKLSYLLKLRFKS